MKKLTPFLASLCLLAAPAFAVTGPGPWASGAYYPGQYDGVYSASITGDDGTTGLMSFALKNGSPTTSSNSTASAGSNGVTVNNTITVNPFQNFFIIYMNGLTYAGLATASINGNAKSVTGALYSGSAPSSTVNIYSTNVTITAGTTGNTTNYDVSVTEQTIENTCGGAFTAEIDSFNALTTFSGNNTGTLATQTNGVADFENTFSVTGIKVSSTPDASSATQ